MYFHSRFRGVSGEIVRSHVSPFTFFYALPVAIVLLALGWGGEKLGDYRAYITVPVIFTFTAMVTMRYAIPASHGDDEPTNDLGEIMTYTGRYLLLTITWSVPWFLLSKLFEQKSQPFIPILLMNPMAMLNSAWLLILKFSLLLAALILPTLSLLISLNSSSVEELYKKKSWEWLLVRRRDDLLPYWSSLAGGSIIMIIASLLPAMLLTYLGFKDSLKTGLVIAGFLYVWIFATIPILNGKLAGAFVAEDLAPAFEPEQPEKKDSQPVNTLQPAQPRTPPEPKPDLQQIEQDLARLENSMLPDALVMAEEKVITQTAPIRGEIEQTIICIRLGDTVAAAAHAAAAIDSSAQRGFGDISRQLFEKMGTERRRLKLASYTLELLGNIYQQRKQLMEAAWCLHGAAANSGDPLKAQKRLFQIAELSEKSNNYKEALTLYEILIKQYPESTLADFARQGATRARSQI